MSQGIIILRTYVVINTLITTNTNTTTNTVGITIIAT